MEHGDRIAYTVLAEGTPVLASDGTQIGTVRRVLADEDADIFDGITIDARGEERFIDAPEIADVFERAVVLTISADQARALPEHTASPAVMDIDPDDVAGDTSGDKARNVFKRAWDRISGKY